MTPKEIIAVLEAYDAGKTVQWKSLMHGCLNWISTRKGDGSTPVWDFTEKQWRIKPEPREFWINKYPDSYPCVHYSKQEAEENAMKRRIECIHVREVLE